MIVIGLTQQVDTDAELKALDVTTLTDYQTVWHNGIGSAYQFYPNHNVGDLIPDNQQNDVGVWRKESTQGCTLAEYKAVRYKEIDARTGELILLGFTHATKVFSLSQNAQINISGLHQSRDDVAMTYPISYSTLDDSEHYDVVDSADLHNMYLAALGTKKGHVDTGTVLKDSVRGAVDEVAVLAIIDNR